MDPSEKREFAAADLDAALDYVEALPSHFRRVQVEVWGHDSGWRFAYGDDRVHAAGLLELVVRGRRFRIRGVTDILDERTSPILLRPSRHER